MPLQYQDYKDMLEIHKFPVTPEDRDQYLQPVPIKLLSVFPTGRISDYVK